MIDSVNFVKGDKASSRILVSGIIGWPPDPNTPLAGVTTSDQWRIAKDPTSLPTPQDTLWDYMPICTVPAQKSADGNIYKAYGGLRLKKFIDAYGDNGKVFSICNSNFTDAMIQIGNAIVQVLKPGCVYYPLIDTQPSPNGGARGPVQPECQVLDRISCDTPGKSGTNCLASGYQEQRLLECKDGQGRNLDPASLDPSPPNAGAEGNSPAPNAGARSQAQIDAVLAAVPEASRPCWYLSYDHGQAGCSTAPMGQRISALRPTGTVAPAGTVLAMKCLTCAKDNQQCPPLNP